MANRFDGKTVFDGLSDAELIGGYNFPSAQDRFVIQGARRWNACVRGRFVGHPGGYPSIKKAVAAARRIVLAELKRRGCWLCEAESGDLV